MIVNRENQFKISDAVSEAFNDYTTYSYSPFRLDGFHLWVGHPMCPKNNSLRFNVHSYKPKLDDYLVSLEKGLSIIFHNKGSDLYASIVYEYHHDRSDTLYTSKIGDDIEYDMSKIIIPNLSRVIREYLSSNNPELLEILDYEV